MIYIDTLKYSVGDSLRYIVDTVVVRDAVPGRYGLSGEVWSIICFAIIVVIGLCCYGLFEHQRRKR